MNKKPKIEVNRAKNNEFFLTVVAANGRKIVTSGETYKRRAGVENALEKLRTLIPTAKVVDNTQE